MAGALIRPSIPVPPPRLQLENFRLSSTAGGSRTRSRHDTPVGRGKGGPTPTGCAEHVTADTLSSLCSPCRRPAPQAEHVGGRESQQDKISRFRHELTDRDIPCHRIPMERRSLRMDGGITAMWRKEAVHQSRGVRGGGTCNADEDCSLPPNSPLRVHIRSAPAFRTTSRFCAARPGGRTAPGATHATHGVSATCSVEPIEDPVLIRRRGSEDA